MCKNSPVSVKYKKENRFLFLPHGVDCRVYHMPEIIKIGYFLTGVIQKAFWDTVHIELWLILSSICVKKIHQFLSSINKDARKRKLVSFFFLTV